MRVGERRESSIEELESRVGELESLATNLNEDNHVKYHELAEVRSELEIYKKAFELSCMRLSSAGFGMIPFQTKTEWEEIFLERAKGETDVQKEKE